MARCSFAFLGVLCGSISNLTIPSRSFVDKSANHLYIDAPIWAVSSAGRAWRRSAKVAVRVPLESCSSFVILPGAVSSAGRAREWHSRGQRFDPATVHAMFYVYILQSQKTKRYYAGHTHDLQHRLEEHNSGKSPSTRNARPWILLHYEKLSTRGEAMKQERKIKKRGLARYLAGISNGTESVAQ